MSNKFNPFKPNSPVYSGMFAGRSSEIQDINNALFQTKNGNPNHIMIIGERGIGKTSLLLLTKNFANGEVVIDRKDKKHNFLTVQINLNNKMSVSDLAISLKNKLNREINKINPNIVLIKKCWDFISKIEVAGLSYKGSTQNFPERNQIIEEFTYSLVDTVKSLTQNVSSRKVGFTEKMDGLIILIDEADNACPDLDLGVFLKNLSEILVAENCNNILFVLAGLPNLHDVLKNSHESSLRLFKEYYLSPLTKNEVNQLINNGLKESSNKSEIKTKITKDALDMIYEFSEGYPHFVQQVGFSAFEVDENGEIDNEDVAKGFFSKNGALNMIGDRYYKKLYYGDINTDLQREILDIMAEKWNGWTGRDFISEKFSKKKTSLDSGIRALKEKNIILAKEGQKGQYRLQWKSFAFWIKCHKQKQK